MLVQCLDNLAGREVGQCGFEATSTELDDAAIVKPNPARHLPGRAWRI